MCPAIQRVKLHEVHSSYVLDVFWLLREVELTLSRLLKRVTIWLSACRVTESKSSMTSTTLHYSCYNDHSQRYKTKKQSCVLHDQVQLLKIIILARYFYGSRRDTRTTKFNNGHDLSRVHSTVKRWSVHTIVRVKAMAGNSNCLQTWFSSGIFGTRAPHKDTSFPTL